MVQHPSPGFRQPALGLLLALLLAGLVASPSRAHDVPSIAIGAESVVVRTPLGSEEFRFRSTDPDIVLTEDPVVSGAALLVVGEGTFEGRTPLIRLIGWQGPEGGPYEYTGGEAGITSAVLGAGELSIEASGSEWPWSPAGEQETVRVHFQVEEQWYCARFSGMDARWNEAGRFEADAAVMPVPFEECPAMCGNGVIEVGEACDDGNLVETDGCTNLCEIGTCESEAFASTFEAIQNVVFEEESYGLPGVEGATGCAASSCHHPETAATAGNLDLSAGVSYQQLLGLDGLGAESSLSTMARVEPLAPHQSFLYRKLASRVDPGLLQFPLEPDEGSPMPLIGVPLDPSHLEAIRLWILNGAPRDTVVAGTQALLGVCLPEAEPQKIPVPPPPPPDPITGDRTGVQLRQTPWPLYGRTPDTQGEDEICMATYYDVSALVPDWAKVPCPDRFQQRQGVCSNNNETLCDQDTDCGSGNTCQGLCSLDTGRRCNDDADCATANAGTCNPVKNATNTGNECFAWHRQELRQDPQSHHSIISIYTGAATPDNPTWGVWSRKSDDPDDPCYPPLWADPQSPPAGCPCEPTDLGEGLGYAPDCSGEPVSSVACISYGPADGSNFSFAGGGGNFPNFSGSQQALYDFEFADGVFTTLPLRGIVSWNSHAFNTSSQDTTLAQYLNLHYAAPEDQQSPMLGIFNAQWIFAQNIKPFETQQICATHILPKGARLFQLSSHTHVRGVHWRTWLPPNDPCQPRCPVDEFGDNATCVADGAFCSCENVYSCTQDFLRPCSSDNDCRRADSCNFAQLLVPFCDDLGYPRESEPDYESFEYSDPVNQILDPPLAFDSDDFRERTLLFCSEYDNGATGRAPVKRQSTAPVPPPLAFLGFPLPPDLIEPAIGGPCPDELRYCVDGDNQGLRCGDQADPHGFCGDPAELLCDACPAHGGVTTGDEMFILLGNFFMVPEPGALALGLAALFSVGLLARRVRRRPGSALDLPRGRD